MSQRDDELSRETQATRIVASLDDIGADYDVVLCDLWGCYHNGVEPYPAAVSALRRFRLNGGKVVLLTNAPRPNEAVSRHLDRMGAPKDSFDAIVSSGDATRAEVGSGRWGRRLHIVGPERDDMIWRGLDMERVALGDAEAILCTGLFDDAVETPADYADLIADGVARGLPFLCANPDIVVDRGEERLFCAGAIAAEYQKAGGAVHLFGKPHAPIYALALSEAARVAGTDVDRGRILAIGDGIATDVLGADQSGLDCLFVSGGLAAAEVGDAPDWPDPDRLARYLVVHKLSPRYAIGRLG